MEEKREFYNVICDGINKYYAKTKDKRVWGWASVMEGEALREQYKRGFNQPDTKYLEFTTETRPWAALLKSTGGNFDRNPVLREIFFTLLKFEDEL